MTRFRDFALLACGFLAPATTLQAQLEFGLFAGRNNGEHILETGSRIPDLNGFAGGSRLTYPRDFNRYGLFASYEYGPFRFEGRFGTTGGWVNPGTARNEDFAMDLRSGQRVPGFDWSNYSFLDSGHVFTGTRNFADAYGRSSMKANEYEVLAKWFPATSEESRVGPYIGVGLQYSYFKHRVYDVIQYFQLSRTRVFLGPIGIGNSFSNAVWELPYGVGYRADFDSVALDASIFLVAGRLSARDHHVQRDIDFEISSAYGDGLLYRLALDVPYEGWIFRVTAYGHRLYTRGLLTARGGLGEEYYLIAISGKQNVYINTKEAGVEMSVVYRWE